MKTLRFKFVIAALLGAGLVFMILEYAGEIVSKHEWRWVEVPLTSAVSANLFKQLRDHDVVRFDKSAPEFVQDPCEALEDDQVPHQADLTEFGAVDALRRLCQSGPGADIREELSVWNASFKMLAIRDNSDQKHTCDNNKPVPTGVIPQGCKGTRWSVTRKKENQNVNSSSFVQTVDRSPPHRAFAHISQDGSSMFSDWIMVSNRASEMGGPDAVFRFDSMLENTGAPIIINLIGNPVGFAIDGAERNFSLNSARTFRLKGHRVQVTLTCDRGRGAIRVSNCNQRRKLGAAHSFRIVVTPGKRRGKIPFTVFAGFATALPPEFVAYKSNPKFDKLKFKRTDHIQIACLKDQEPECDTSWVASQAFEKLKRQGYSLKLSDGTVLIDQDGRTTPDVLEYGLLAMVGFSSADNGSLSAGLASKSLNKSTTFELTINPRMQKIVQAEISQRVAKFASNEYRRRNARGAIVLLDAGDDPETRGHVLAVGSVPEFKLNLHIWDMIALAEAGGVNNPLAGHGWRGTDAYSTPGSSFKTMTGLSAIEAAIDNPDLQDMVLGAVTQQELTSLIRTSNNNVTVNGGAVVILARGKFVKTIGGVFAKALKPTKSSKCPKEIHANQISLCEALIVSSNPWFSGVNLYMDGTTAWKKEGGLNTAINRTIGRLFPMLEPEDRRKAGCDKCLDLTWGVLPKATRVRVEPIDAPMVSNELPGSTDIAHNSFGQGVRAAPMAMASLYATIASGMVTTPRELKAAKISPWDSTGTPIMPTDNEFTKKALQNLRFGLYGVSNSPYGTARRVKFAPFKVYAKTGTARALESLKGQSGRVPNAASFSGWVEPHGNIKKRIAFVCWLSHMPVRGADGSRICAPAIRNVIEKISKLGSTQ